MKKNFCLRSHVSPLYPNEQEHSNPPLTCVQVPPFKQGFGLHLVCNTEKQKIDKRKMRKQYLIHNCLVSIHDVDNFDGDSYSLIFLYHLYSFYLN